VKPAVLTWSSLGYPNQPEFTVIANSNRLASSPAYKTIVKHFITALVDGEKAAEANPSGATTIMEKVTQYTKPFLVASDPVTLAALEPPKGAWGCFKLRPAGRPPRTSTPAIQLITGPVTVAKLFSNSYIPWSCPSS